MDPQLNSKLEAFALTTSSEAKALRALINGNKLTLAALQTQDKTNLVAAINEVLGSAHGAQLEDVDIAVSDYFVLHPQSFVYEQTEAVYNTLITHPLDHPPVVNFTDSAGSSWLGQVSYPARNQVLVQFNVPLAGKFTLT